MKNVSDDEKPEFLDEQDIFPAALPSFVTRTTLREMLAKKKMNTLVDFGACSPALSSKNITELNSKPKQ